MLRQTTPVSPCPSRDSTASRTAPSSPSSPFQTIAWTYLFDNSNSPCTELISSHTHILAMNNDNE